jgi:cytochrome bd-type quinol oxidase subunit 2
VAGGNSGPVGQPRGVVFVILIGIITFGIYWIYWVYKTQEEVKQHSNQGVGGVLGLVIYILIGVVSVFLIPSEIGKMLRQDGRESPISGWTGLWLFPFGIFIIPGIVWAVKVQGTLNDYWQSKGAV